MSNAIENIAGETGYDLKTCRGTVLCKHSAAPAAGLVRLAGTLLAGRDLGSFLASKIKGPVRAHDRFRVAVAACPNSCSQPQIADVAFMGACVPRFTGQECFRCQACVRACKENVVTLSDDFAEPTIHFANCLTCGQCAQVCPSGCLAEGVTGWRVLIGGRLGRHPALATEITGLYSDEEAVAVLETCLDIFTTCHIPGKRFGEILEAAGGLDCITSGVRSPELHPMVEMAQ